MTEWAGGPVPEGTAFYSKANPGVAGSLAQEVARLSADSGLFCLLRTSQCEEVSSLCLHSGSEQRHIEYDSRDLSAPQLACGALY